MRKFKQNATERAIYRTLKLARHLLKVFGILGFIFAIVLMIIVVAMLIEGSNTGSTLATGVGYLIISTITISTSAELQKIQNDMLVRVDDELDEF